MRPGKGEDAVVVEVLEGGHWVLGVSEIPDLERGVLIVIIGNEELGWDLWVPNHAGLSAHWLLRLGLGSLVVSKVVEVVLLLLILVLTRLREREDALADLQVPHHDLPVLTRTSQNVRHDPVPAD